MKIILKSILNMIRVLPLVIIVFLIVESFFLKDLGRLIARSRIFHLEPVIDLFLNIWGLVVLTFVISFVSILRQARKYNAFEEISIKDFLESKHRLSFANSSVVMDVFENEVQSVFADVTLTDAQDEHGYRMYSFSTNRGYGNYLKVDFLETKTVLSIKPKWYVFLPDNARNYRLLQRLKTKIEAQMKQNLASK